MVLIVDSTKYQNVLLRCFARIVIQSLGKVRYGSMLVSLGALNTGQIIPQIGVTLPLHL